MEPINGVSLEQYATLCALMADTAGDESKEIAISEENNVSGDDWKAAKQGFTARMSDPTDMGKTALAFMPLLQEAQTKLRGGVEPCTLEVYARVHAGMAYRKDPADSSKKIDYMVVLGENGFTHQQWIECENYWTPVVSKDESKPTLMERFDETKGAQFKQIIQEESDKISGIER
jgi:hypothetical protein